MKFLFTTLATNDLGLLTRSLPIAHELRSRGHDVAFSSPARAPSKLIADAGFDNLIPPHPLYTVLADPSIARIIRDRRWRRHGSLVRFIYDLVRAMPTKFSPRTREVWNMDHAGARMGLLDESFVRATVDAMKRLIAQLRPDVVVDFWNPLAVIAARVLGVPVATVIQADAHPASAGFLWWKKPRAEPPTPARVINRVLATYGLPAIRKLADLSVGDLTLVVGTRETDPVPGATPAGITYIGSVLWQQAGASLPSSITSLSPSKPLVWVYSGNPKYSKNDDSLDSLAVIEASIAAFSTLDVHVVLTTGHHALPSSLAPLPGNFVHEPYVPGLAMAARCDLLVHHGGYGSCQTGLHAGKPAVILPTYSERESNARRMVAIGAAIMVPVTANSSGKHVDPRVLATAVMRALSDPSLATNARAAGDRLRAEGGPERAAELVEDLGHARRRAPVVRPR